MQKISPAVQRQAIFSACQKVRSDFFDKLRQNRKIKINIYFAILVAAAGDQTRKGTLTVPFHTILPSDTCDRAGFLTVCYKSTTVGVCPVWGRRRVSTSEVFSFSVLVQMQGWQDI